MVTCVCCCRVVPRLVLVREPTRRRRPEPTGKQQQPAVRLGLRSRSRPCRSTDSRLLSRRTRQSFYSFPSPLPFIHFPFSPPLCSSARSSKSLPHSLSRAVSCFQVPPLPDSRCTTDSDIQQVAETTNTPQEFEGKGRQNTQRCINPLQSILILSN